MIDGMTSIAESFLEIGRSLLSCVYDFTDRHLGTNHCNVPLFHEQAMNDTPSDILLFLIPYVLGNI